jgi:ABC-type sugar transport system substrate-binding protein
MPDNSLCTRLWPFLLRVGRLVTVAVFVTLCLASPVRTGERRVVGALLLSLQYPFLVTLNKAMETEAAKQHIDLVSLDPRQSVSIERHQVDDLIHRKVELIVMIPVDQKTSQIAAKLINSAAIPLVLLNTKFADDFASNGGQFVTYVGSDDTEAGKIQGQYLADKLPGGGDVVYLVGEYGGASTERRKAGFESVMENHPNLHIVAELQGHGAQSDAKAIMEKLLREHGKGQLQALVAQNDEMAIGASSAIQAADRLGEFRVLIGVDGSKAALDAVRDGTLTATVFQDAVGQGREAIDAAAGILAGESIGPQFIIPFKLVTKDNVSSF